MQLMSYVYPLALLIPGLAAAAVAVHAWQRRATPGGGPLAGLMLTVAWWSLFYAAELFFVDARTQLLCTRIQYFGIAFLPLFWAIFALDYGGLKSLLTPWRLVLLSVIPVFTIIMVWSNDAHGLYYRAIYPHVFGDLHTISADRGPAYWLHIAYSDLLILTGLIVIARAYLRSSHSYRGQARMILIAALVPWIASGVYLAGYSPITGLDLTPYAFTVTGIAVAWSLFRLGLLDLVPVARNAVFEAISDGALVIDEHERVVDSNAAAERILGLKARELIGMAVHKALPCWPQVKAYCDPAGRHRFKQTLGYNGTSGTYELRLFLLRRTQSEIPSRLLLISDITERERTEQALRATEVSYHELFNAVGEAIYVQDRDGRFLDVNCGAEAMYGYPRERFIGNTPDFLSAPGRNDLSQLGHFIEAAFGGEPQQFEFWGVRANGEIFPKELRLYKGTYLGQDAVIALATDITARKTVEDAQRLAAVGELAAGVAHEFNNLLAAMLLAAEVADPEDPRTANEFRQVVLRSARRGAATCADLMAFARPPEPRREIVAVEDIIENALSVARRQLENAQIPVQREYDVPGAYVNGDPAQLEQVMLNLIINAADAMSDPQIPLERRRLTIRVGMAPEAPAQIQISVSDTGAGITPEHLPRIFEPFFTTKTSSLLSQPRGTGLGLSVSHGIITAHHGRMEARSDVGQGSTFIMHLPAADGAARQAEVPQGAQPALAKSSRCGRILLAEDEPDVRKSIVEALARLGHTVTPVATTGEALSAMKYSSFDVVITDLMLPGDGGSTILRHSQALPAPVPTLIITGKLDPQLNERMNELGASAVLQKPFSLTTLLDSVADLLGE